MRTFGSALLLQTVTVICGFIIPALTIAAFGSAANGLVASIFKFLGYIALIETGVGGVIRTALYKPLADGDFKKISRVIRAAETFYRNIAFLFAGYMAVTAVLFPYINPGVFDGWYTASLVLIIGASSFFQYYFGLTYHTLLEADQKKYIVQTVQIGATVLNTVLIVALIKAGASLHIVRIGSAFVFLLRPLFLYFYVRRHYPLDKNCAADTLATEKRWDGFGHHIAYFLHTSADVAVLTVFTDYMTVSVYAVHNMIVTAVAAFARTVSGGFEAALGNMLAKNETAALARNFQIYELIVNAAAVILFTSTALLINPFILIYTQGFTDIGYARPVFAYLLVLAEGIFCLRLPYQALVNAAGHYKETRGGAFAEAAINVLLSVILVRFFGLAGVAFGTAAAMLFRTIDYAVYSSKNILKRSLRFFIKRIFVSAGSAAAIIVIAGFLPNRSVATYGAWLLYAVQVTAIAAAVTGAGAVLFYREDVRNMAVALKTLFQNIV